MKIRFLLPFVALMLVAAILLSYSADIKDDNKTYLVPEISQMDDFHLAYSMQKEFYGNLAAEQKSDIGEEKIYGGIVSHHLLAAKEIAGFFAALKAQPPKTIVIVGPNHFNVGDGDILVSDDPYKTPWGIVYPEKGYIGELLAKNVVLNDENPFADEHSISSLVSFVKYYLPDTKIVPIIIKRNTAKQRVEKLAVTLDEILPEYAIVVSSVDFSHHLDANAADFHDEKSIASIKSFDYAGLFKSEIDSPLSVYALLRFLELRSAQKMAYDSTNSTDIMRNSLSDDVTSYLFAHFVAGDVQEESKISVLNLGGVVVSNDEANLFEEIRGAEGNFLRGADFISVSAEAGEECSDLSSNLCGLMAKNGINMADLTGNRTNDCGEKTISAMKNSLSGSNIVDFGADFLENSYTQKEISGSKIAFIGINMTSDAHRLQQYFASIKELRKNNDYLVAYIHWGIEYRDNVSLSQKNIAHSLVESGADLVIGHRFSAIQPVEVYKNKAIFYASGDLVPGRGDADAVGGLGIGTIFSKEGLRFYLFPYEIKDHRPILSEVQESLDFCDRYLSGIDDKNGCSFNLVAE